MKYLTSKEYADLIGVSRQAIEDRIERGTLPIATVKVKVKRIPVEDTEYEKIKANHLQSARSGE